MMVVALATLIGGCQVHARSVPHAVPGTPGSPEEQLAAALRGRVGPAGGSHDPTRVRVGVTERHVLWAFELHADPVWLDWYCRAYGFLSWTDQAQIYRPGASSMFATSIPFVEREHELYGYRICQSFLTSIPYMNLLVGPVADPSGRFHVLIWCDLA